MRLQNIRLITWKETRDLLRDRRTLVMLFIAPMILYPLFGLTGWLFATELIGKAPKIGVVNLDEASIGDAGFPPMFKDGAFAELPAPKTDSKQPDTPPQVVKIDGDPEEALRTKQAQVIIVVPPGFQKELAEGKTPTVKLLYREGDDKAKVALTRTNELLRAWEAKARAVKFQRDGKPANYDKVLVIDDPRAAKPAEKKAADELRDSFARSFPLILVMWLVAGAIQPAVDLTAGEKERGTMETLLISPAHRSEIVLGKFLAVTIFGFASVLWNVVCLTIAALVAQGFLKYPIINLPGMAGCVLFSLPIAMLFSAVSIALGVFARSTKEGQYYLVPLMLTVMPLAFWSLIPSTELSPVTACIPVVGGMLFQQKLLAVTGDPIPWGYAVPVLGAQALYVALALTAAWWQFTREGVLFREVGKR
jgi:sodium transport system permease protein